MTIPKLIHFIWFTGPQSRDFSYINYLAVKAAAILHENYAIFMHCNEEPVGNAHWDNAKPYMSIIQTTPPTAIQGVPIQYVQYQSDVTRMYILLKSGGIYIDTDMILLRSIDELTNNDDAVILAEESPTSLANGVIFAIPNATFLRIWLAKIPIAMQSPIWAHHAVLLPRELQQQHSYLVKVLPPEDFFPLDLKANYLLEADPIGITHIIDRIGDAYGIHVYETYWAPDLHKMTKNLMGNDNVFSRLFGWIDPQIS